MNGEIPDFNRTQLHVLQILWESELPLKPGEIEERFEWPIENATLRSVLKVMMESGELNRERSGKAYVYSASREKRSALSEFMGGLARVFSGGSRTALLAQLLQDETLSDQEVNELQKIANRTQSQKMTDEQP